jgi:hypothetical protein
VSGEIRPFSGQIDNNKLVEDLPTILAIRYGTDGKGALRRGKSHADARANPSPLASKMLRAIRAPAPFPGWD